MKKFWKYLFKNNQPKPIQNITCGDRDENGFCDTYVDGVKTNVRMLIFTQEEIKKLTNLINQ